VKGPKRTVFAGGAASLLRGMKSREEGTRIKVSCLKSISSGIVEPRPVWIDDHQFDVRSLGDDIVDPTLFLIVLENAAIELTGLPIGNGIKIDTIEILKCGQHIAVKSRGATAVEIRFGPLPPSIESLPRIPSREVARILVIAGTP
jgi:hypothetical protein